MSDLTAFVPRLATELASTEGAYWASVEGSMLSADISGFTALSEKLAGKGKAGAEEITELINACFTALIDAAYGFGGEIIKFGGDALLVLFRGDAHERRCANAALAMQLALRSSSAAKSANLDMTVGASHGPFDVFLAGSTYRDLLIIGPAASQVIHLEGEADKGETLVSPEIAAFLPKRIVGRSHAGGLAIGGEPLDPPTDPEVRLVADVDLRPFVPPAVVEQLSAFAELGGEHRIVSVGFVMVTGVEQQIEATGPETTAATLGRLLDDLLNATAPYGVTALHTDIAPDGFKVVMCAGAPVSTGDTSDALLQAALAIAAIDSPLVLRQGAQTGRVYAGFLGAPYRQTYTLMGDPVNTAARMLGKTSDREIVAVGTMVEDTRTIFVTEELEPFLVKGKTEPIVAHKVLGATDEVRRGGSATRLYGRRRELEVLTRAIGELGEVIELVGPAGVGKSRLLDAAWDEAEGLTAFHGACTPYGVSSPYGVFRAILRGGSGIDPNASPTEAGQILTRIVTEHADHLLPMLPLLAVPFGAVVTPTPEANAIEAEFRRARIHDTVVDFLDSVLTGPVFLVVEDLHWVDDASGELVNHLIKAGSTRPWAGVMTRRPEGSWHMPVDLPHVTTIQLGELDADDIRDLAIESSTRALADAELAVIVERSQGNPLFAIELAKAVSTSSLEDLPDSVETVISSRIDDLDPAHRRLVRIASVFGPTFALDDFLPVLNLEAPGMKLDGRSVAGILERKDRVRWGFTHALYRDVAYEGLPYKRRAYLHGVVGKSLEAHADEPEEISGLLSLHFSEAKQLQRAWHYSVIAGDRATRLCAFAEAATAFERASKVAHRLPDVTRAERARIAEQRGDALSSLGRYPDARKSLASARTLNDDLVRELHLMRKLGTLQERQGDLGGAIRWYGRARRLAESSDTSFESLAAHARAELADAGIRFRRGEFERCRELARRALIRSIEARDYMSQALALDRLHVSTVYLREPDQEMFGDRATEAFTRLDDIASRARVLNNRGIEAYFGGDWSAASDFYRASMADGIAAGNVVEASLAGLNSGEILSDQGRWDDALVQLQNALRNWEAAGYATGIAAAHLFIGVTHLRAGRPEAAEQSLGEAHDRLEALGLNELIDDARARLLELGVLVGSATTADTEAFLGQLGAEHPLAARAMWLHALALHHRGDTDESRALLIAASTVSSGYERALVLHHLAAFHSSDELADRWASEAAEIQAGLGVLRIREPALRYA